MPFRTATVVCWTVVLLAMGHAAEAQQAAGGPQNAVPTSPKQRAFDALDRDHNGVLIVDEFLGGSLGKAAEAKRQAFRKLDSDDSGALEFNEFDKYGKPSPKWKELESRAP